MRGLTKALIITAMLIPLVSQAASMNVGIIDIQKALLKSKAAQEYTKSSKKNYQPRLDKLEALRDKIKSKEEKLRKNSASLSKDELQKQEEGINKEKEKFYQQLQQLREEKEKADKNELDRLEPQLKQAIEAVAKKEHFTLVLDKSAVVYQKGESEITDQVIAILDKKSMHRKNMHKEHGAQGKISAGDARESTEKDSNN